MNARYTLLCWPIVMMNLDNPRQYSSQTSIADQLSNAQELFDRQHRLFSPKAPLASSKSGRGVSNYDSHFPCVHTTPHQVPLRLYSIIVWTIQVDIQHAISSRKSSESGLYTRISVSKADTAFCGQRNCENTCLFFESLVFGLLQCCLS